MEDLGTNRDSDEYERALSALRASLFRDHPPSPAVPDPPPPVLVEEPEYVVVESPQPPTTPQRRPSLSDTLSSFSIGRLRRQRSLFVRLDAPAMGSSPRSPAPLTAPPAFESVPLSSPAEMPLSAAEAADAYVRLHDQLDRLRHLRGKAASDRELLVEHLQQVGAASAGAPQEGRASRSSSFIGRAAVEIFSMLPGALTARPQEAAASASTDGIEPLNSPLSLESLINRAASSTNLKQFEQSTFSAVRTAACLSIATAEPLFLGRVCRAVAAVRALAPRADRGAVGRVCRRRRHRCQRRAGPRVHLLRRTFRAY